MSLIIFYGANAKLAREMGVPVFLDGDTGEVVQRDAQDRSYRTVEEPHPYPRR